MDGTGIRKFVDDLPQVGAETSPSIPVAVPDTTTYPGVRLLRDRAGRVRPSRCTPTCRPPSCAATCSSTPRTSPATGCRWKAWVAPHPAARRHQAVGVTQPIYLGPAIVAEKDRPVRILFRNLLPTGEDGNLFIPVDTTVMGSGMTADGHEMDPTRRTRRTRCLQRHRQGRHGGRWTCVIAENRAVIHLHGGITPWISDGTPHQWITPAGENTAYPEGVSVENVPDMGAAATPDRRSDDLLLHQPAERAADVLPRPRLGHHPPQRLRRRGRALHHHRRHREGAGRRRLCPRPRTRSRWSSRTRPSSRTRRSSDLQDETWDTAPLGRRGQPVGAPRLLAGAEPGRRLRASTQFGRWAYGPWFWPPTNNIEYGPIANPYFDDTCDPDLGWCEPPLMPGTPYNSMGMESFNDTPVDQRHGLPNAHSRSEGLPLQDPERGQRPLLQPVAVQGRRCQRRSLRCHQPQPGA